MKKKLIHYMLLLLLLLLLMLMLRESDALILNHTRKESRALRNSPCFSGTALPNRSFLTLLSSLCILRSFFRSTLGLRGF